MPDHVDRAAIDQIGKVLLGSLTKGLLLLRGINAGEPDFERLVIGVKHGDGVSVTHAYDLAGEGGCGGLAESEKQGATENAPDGCSCHLSVNAAGCDGSAFGDRSRHNTDYFFHSEMDQRHLP